MQSLSDCSQPLCMVRVLGAFLFFSPEWKVQIIGYSVRNLEDLFDPCVAVYLTL